MGWSSVTSISPELWLLVQPVVCVRLEELVGAAVGLSKNVVVGLSKRIRTRFAAHPPPFIWRRVLLSSACGMAWHAVNACIAPVAMSQGKTPVVTANDTNRCEPRGIAAEARAYQPTPLLLGTMHCYVYLLQLG